MTAGLLRAEDGIQPIPDLEETLMWTRSHVRTAALAVTVLLAGQGIAACGDDDAAAADLEPFCDAYADTLRAAIGGDPDAEVAGLSKMIDVAPADAVGPLTEFRDAVIADGQEAAHEGLGEETLAVIGKVARSCAGDELNVVAFDYGFSGIPEELTVGRHIVTLTNSSEDEEHEAIFLRKNDGVTLGAAELFQLPEEEVETKIAPVAFMHAGNPDEAWVVDFDSGDYIVVCFLPVGGDESGLPHVAEGMVSEFSVTA